MNVCRLFALVCVIVPAAGIADARAEKMCWAHYVGWGFDQVAGYDRAAFDPAWYAQRFNDRSLLGRHAQTDEGVGEATPLQIRTALQYGVDGFCVDLVLGAKSPETAYADAMARFYRGAEGTPFKIALCVDGTDVPPDALTRALAAFLTRWGRHPNACLVDGKPVIFIYNPRPRTNDEWRGVLAALGAQGLRATWLVQPLGEGTLWDKPEALAASLAVFDGLYDFGINGFTPEQMFARLDNGRRALSAAHKPDALWAAGITVGYLGNANSFYRPYLGTGTLRANWDAAIRSGAPWVCLTTWNDYVENTHFEPSAVNRDALLRINRDLASRWRGTPVPPRPPQVFVSYHEEVSLGDDLTLEVLSLPYHTAHATLSVRLVPLAPSTNDAVAFTVALPNGDLQASPLRVPHPFTGEGGGVYAVQAQLSSDDAGADVWRTLYPIAVRSGHLESLRTLRIPMDELAAEPRLTLAAEGRRRVAHVRFDRWNLAGKVELLRNGWPVAETELAHKGAPSVTVSLPLPDGDATPRDLLVARYSTLAGHVSWSAPLALRAGDATVSRPRPVIVTGVDFDEGWNAPKDATSPVLATCPESAPYALTYPMDEGAGDQLRSTSGWSTPLFLGRTHRHLTSAETGRLPAWQPAGDGRGALFFDGTNSCAVLPSRSFPYGPFTLEMNVRPEAPDTVMTLFADACGVTLALTPEGRVRFTRAHDALTGSRALNAGRWARVAASYDGARLRLSVDGQPDGEAPAETRVLRINSLPVIGADGAYRTGFRGLIGGLHLQSGVLEPGHDVLRTRTPSSDRANAAAPTPAK